MSALREVLMDRDGISYREAELKIQEARKDLYDRISQGEMPGDICADWFEVEPDYIMDLL